MASSSHSSLESAIGLLSHDDENQRRAALHGVTVMLARHGLDWRRVGEIVAEHLTEGGLSKVVPRHDPTKAPTSGFHPSPFSHGPSGFEPGFTYTHHGTMSSDYGRSPQILGPERIAGVNIPNEVIGRIVVRDATNLPTLLFDVDDNEEVYGPIATVPGAVSSVLAASGRRAVVKLFPIRQGMTMPRAHEVTIID